METGMVDQPGRRGFDQGWTGSRVAVHGVDEIAWGIRRQGIRNLTGDDRIGEEAAATVAVKEHPLTPWTLEVTLDSGQGLFQIGRPSATSHPVGQIAIGVLQHPLACPDGQHRLANPLQRKGGPGFHTQGLGQLG